MQADVTYAGDELSRLMTVLGTFLAVILCVAVVWKLLCIVAYWRIFTKCREPGWKSVVPIYSDYVLYDKVWAPLWFWVNLVLNAVTLYTNPSAAEGSMTALQMVGAVCMIAGLVLYALLNHKTARAFGKGIGFTIGLIFLQPVFLMILGFGSAQYQGPQ